MHYQIMWLGDNHRAYWKGWLTLDEMKKFIKRKGWENTYHAWGPEVTMMEDESFICSPGVFMNYQEEDQQ